MCAYEDRAIFHSLRNTTNLYYSASMRVGVWQTVVQQNSIEPLRKYVKTKSLSLYRFAGNARDPILVMIKKRRACELNIRSKDLQRSWFEHTTAVCIWIIISLLCETRKPLPTSITASRAP